MITELLILLGTIIFAIFYYNKQYRPKNFPPGPFIFPVVGTLPILALSQKSFLDQLIDWKAKYGQIFSLGMGPYRAVVIHDYDLLKEAFNEYQLTGRPMLPPIKLVAGPEKRGIIASEGPQWESQRRFALKNLRDFGFGKKSMETTAHEDIADLIEKFKKQEGELISTHLMFSNAVVNSLWNIISGERHDLDDPKFNELLRTVKAVIESAATSGPLFTMEWLLKLAPTAVGWDKVVEGIANAKSFISNQIKEHRDSFEDQDSARDFMDVYLREIKNTTDPQSFFYGHIGEENLLVGSLNLLAAGTETTSSTMNWSLYFLSQNPEVQKKFQAEIDLVVGRSRLPSLGDRDSIPYVSATITEILRKSSLTPLGVVHRALSDVNFHGFTITKDTLVFGNLYELHHNEKVWGDPQVFRPERFLEPDEKSLKKIIPHMAPFSVGKRQCLGEILARNNIFLFLTALFQRFNVKQDPNHDKNAKETSGLFRFPPPFKVIFEERA